ncbi:helix-turn-helix transcriptional regulator, partial [Sandaracinobacter neustonicus]
MDSENALSALAALSQQTRLDAFRLLVRHEPEGLPAGDIARHLDVPANTLSTHLAILARAGLVTSERHGRVIQYRADVDGLRALMLFLVKDCCAGSPE